MKEQRPSRKLICFMSVCLAVPIILTACLKDPAIVPAASAGNPVSTGRASVIPGQSTSPRADEMVWWTDHPFPIPLRYNDSNPERYTVITFADLPMIDIRNWSGFDSLRSFNKEINGALVFDKNFNTATLDLRIMESADDINQMGISEPPQSIHAEINFLEKRLTALDFRNLYDQADFLNIEDWLYEKVHDLRMQALDIVINELQYNLDEDELIPSEMPRVIEYEAKRQVEGVSVELTYEPTIRFTNPRKELGDTNSDTVYGVLTLSHNLQRGRLEVIRYLPDASFTEGEAKTDLTIDFATGRIHRSDSAYEDKDGKLHWMDYPDPVLFELAKSMREELLATIATGRPQDHESDPTGE